MWYFYLWQMINPRSSKVNQFESYTIWSLTIWNHCQDAFYKVLMLNSFSSVWWQRNIYYIEYKTPVVISLLISFIRILILRLREYFNSDRLLTSVFIIFLAKICLKINYYVWNINWNLIKTFYVWQGRSFSCRGSSEKYVS